MRQITTKPEGPGRPEFILTLPFEVRCKSRFRAPLQDGEEVAVVLPRGGVLRHGDLLQCDTGGLVEVRAAPQKVSEARTADPFLLALVCYHLGNRHVPLEIGPGWLRYEHDHVLDEMVESLGLRVKSAEAPFEPESGAYTAAGGHHHSHD